VTQASRIPAQAAGRPQLALLWLMSLPVIILTVVGFSVALGGVRGTDIQVLALALVTGAVSLIPIILDVGRPLVKRRLLLGFYLVSHLIFFVVSVFTTYFFADVMVGREEYGFADLKALAPSDIVNGQIVVLVGLLALLAGHAIPIEKLVPGGIPRPRREWSPQATLIVAMVMIPLGWSIYLASQYGVLPKRVGSGFIGQLGNATYLGIALLMLAYLRHRSRAALILMVVLIPPTMVFNYFTGAKGLFFAPAAVTLIAYIVVTRRIRMRWFLVAFVAMSLFYPIANFQRQVILQGNTKGVAFALRKPLEVIERTARFAGSYSITEHMISGIAATSVRFDGLGIASLIVRDCPSRVPFQGGWSLANIPLSFVPRIIWPNKPDLGSGLWVTANFMGGPSPSHTGSTWVGELWYSYGWPGVVAGMFLLGIFFRIVHEVLFQPDAVIAVQLLSVVALFTIPPTLGGALVSPVNGVLLGAIPLAITHWGVRLLSGTPRNAPGREDPHGALASRDGSEILEPR
jgi:hypothetical protein